MVAVPDVCQVVVQVVAVLGYRWAREAYALCCLVEQTGVGVVGLVVADPGGARCVPVLAALLDAIASDVEGVLRLLSRRDWIETGGRGRSRNGRSSDYIRQSSSEVVVVLDAIAARELDTKQVTKIVVRVARDEVGDSARAYLS